LAFAVNLNVGASEFRIASNNTKRSDKIIDKQYVTLNSDASKLTRTQRPSSGTQNQGKITALAGDLKAFESNKNNHLNAI